MKWERANDHEIRALLEEAIPNVRSVHVQHSFRCWRKRNDGSDQEVTVHVLDKGSQGDGGRFSCIAESDDGETATGNPHDDLMSAIGLVHWYELG